MDILQNIQIKCTKYKNKSKKFSLFFSLFDQSCFYLLNQLKNNNKFQGSSNFINSPQTDGFTGN